MKCIRKASLCLIFLLFSVSGAYAESSLGQFINQVLEENPAIQAAQSNVLAARARERALAQPLYNPQLTAEKQNAIDNTEMLEIDQTIDWTNKRGAREQVGAAEVLVAQAQLVAQWQQFAAEILDALAKYQTAQQVVVLTKERTSLLRQFVSLTKKRHANGDIPRVDLDFAQLALSEAIVQQSDAEVIENKALEVLRTITGFSQINGPHLSSSLPSLNIKEIEIENLLSKLPPVLVLNQQLSTTKKRIRVAEQERYPDPTIGIQGGRNTGQDEKRKIVGITLNIPLYVRNTYQAEVDAANFDAIGAEQKRAEIIRQSRAQIISSAERYQILFHASQQWQHVSGNSLKDGKVLIERLWQAGEMNTTDYLVQLKQRVDSEIAGVELKGRAWESFIEWLRVSGQVEKWLQPKS